MLKKKSGSGGSVPLSEEKHRSTQDKEMDYEKVRIYVCTMIIFKAMSYYM